jgi:hypothetical protein
VLLYAVVKGIPGKVDCEATGQSRRFSALTYRTSIPVLPSGRKCAISKESGRPFGTEVSLDANRCRAYSLVQGSYGSNDVNIT